MMMTITRRTRGAGILSVLLVLAVLGSGVARAAGRAHVVAGSVLNVGVNASFTGNSAIIGTHFVRGVEAAVWDINHNSGVLGPTFNVIRADDQDDAADGVAAINKTICSYARHALYPAR
jgi:ABC-type branched-subunit amino acid transport system substrate-binding protein